MSRLTSCYFCGTADESLSEYAVVPPSLRADRTESPSVVLCDQCHHKLLSVVEPILDALDERPHDEVADAEDPSAPSTSEQVSVTFDDEATDADGDATTTADDASPPGTSADERADDEPPASASDHPTGYRQVRRFLQNREFPMDRERAISLLTSAYGLSEETCVAALDHAVEEGVIREDDGRFVRS